MPILSAQGPTDFPTPILDNHVPIIITSVIELGSGIFAIGVATLRPLVHSLLPSEASSGMSLQNSKVPVTFGGGGRRSGPKWRSLSDETLIDIELQHDVIQKPVPSKKLPSSIGVAL
jgi:hypothetical protein